MRNLRTALTIVAVTISGPVLASDLAACRITPEQQAELGCVCVVPISTPVAYLDAIKGEVWKTDKANFTPLTASPSWLEIGDKVLFSGDGEALLTAGACQVPIGPNATLVVYQLEQGCACAALVEDPKPAVVAKHHGLVVGAAALIGLKVLVHSISP